MLTAAWKLHTCKYCTQQMSLIHSIQTDASREPRDHDQNGRDLIMMDPLVTPWQTMQINKYILIVKYWNTLCFQFGGSHWTSWYSHPRCAGLSVVVQPDWQTGHPHTPVKYLSLFSATPCSPFWYIQSLIETHSYKYEGNGNVTGLPEHCARSHCQ